MSAETRNADRIITGDTALAEYLGLSPDTIKRRRQQVPPLPAFRNGRFWCYRQSEVDEWLKLVAGADNKKSIPRKELRRLVAEISSAETKTDAINILLSATDLVHALPPAEREKLSEQLQDAINGT
jgi:hypothetical protein